MTLIQTHFSNDFIIQVADRRLTKSGRKIFDDKYTKLVFWSGSFTIGFTGLARINRSQTKSTSEWIAETVCDYKVFEHGAEILRLEAEKRIKQLPSKWPDRRLAIVIAGFDQRLIPLVAVISNFNIQTGKVSDPETFEITQRLPLDGHPTGSTTVGAPLDPQQKQLLWRYVPRIIRKPNGLNRAVRMMVEIQRRVADQHDTVGRDAQCVVIPRVRDTPIFMSNLGGPDLPPKAASFGFFDSKGWKFEQFGPLTAEGGFARDNLIGKADPNNPDNQSIGFRLLKVPKSWSR